MTSKIARSASNTRSPSSTLGALQHLLVLDGSRRMANAKNHEAEYLTVNANIWTGHYSNYHAIPFILLDAQIRNIQIMRLGLRIAYS